VLQFEVLQFEVYRSDTKQHPFPHLQELYVVENIAWNFLDGR
jgi:hypothetical protein